MTVINLTYGRTKDVLNLTSPLSETTVWDLKVEIEEKTGIPCGNQRLIHAGVVLKNDDQTLENYQFHDQSLVMILGSIKGPAVDPPTRNSSIPSNGTSNSSESSQPPVTLLPRQPAPAPEPEAQHKIDDGYGQSISLPTPAQASYLSQLQRIIASLPETDALIPNQPPSREEFSKHYTKITETLMQALLKVDSLPLPQEDGGPQGRARVARKRAVREVQKMLEEADRIKEQLGFRE